MVRLNDLSRIAFEPVEHRYTLDGETLPSVTQVLRLLNDFSGIPPGVLEKARLRGGDVHDAIELIEADDLDPNTVSDEIAPFLEQYRKFKMTCLPVFSICEGLVFDDGLRIAGTLDLFGTIVRNGVGPVEPWLIDVKTPVEVSRTWALQTWAYLRAALRNGIRQRHTGMIFTIPPETRRGVLHLRPDGWKLVEHEPTFDDEIVWQSACNIHRWKARK